MSTQCIRCLHYLELGDKVVRGVQTGKLYAYDDVVFAEGCSFKGMEATGRRIEVRGKVFSKLRATAEIVALEGSQLSGELHAPVIHVERGAKVKVQTVECARLMVSGDMEISGLLDASEIILSDGATFAGQLHLPDGKLRVERGVSAQFNAITCAEFEVEGRVVLESSLFAEKLTVSAGGSLVCPRLCIGQIDVSPGGFLQGQIEKYVPRGETGGDSDGCAGGFPGRDAATRLSGIGRQLFTPFSFPVILSLSKDQPPEDHLFSRGS